MGKNLPIETIALNAVLGRPEERDETKWRFLGNGAIRLYPKNGVVATETLLWVGVRRAGEKAYRRMTHKTITDTLKKDSTIPVAHAVFTRDIANNVWHLPTSRGLMRAIERLAALHSWADEDAIIYQDNKVTRKKQIPITCEGDLVPVAEKTSYQLDDFPFANK